MENKNFAEFKVGLFVSIAVLVVLMTIIWAKGCAVGTKEQSYVVYFEKVSGINEGDQVSVNGVRKGKIDKLELAGDSVKITFSIDKEIKIRNDYNIYVAATELTGGKVLYIEPGKSSTEVNPDQALHGSTGADFSTIMNSVQGITVTVKDLLGEFKKSADNLNGVLANVNSIVGDENLKGNLRSTLSNLAASSQNINQLVSESRNGINGLTSRLGNTVDNVDLAIGDNSKELKNTLNEIQNLTSTVDTLVYNLNTVVTEINNKEKGIGKFITDDKFFNNMNKTLEEIEKLTKKIRKDGVKINLF
ncbi:MAG TPA: MlaD family protein [Ignavibacteria bacterium]|nr:MlaD family protein [Ignavibacteria bacterium]